MIPCNRNHYIILTLRMLNLLITSNIKNIFHQITSTFLANFSFSLFSMWQSDLNGCIRFWESICNYKENMFSRYQTIKINDISLSYAWIGFIANLTFQTIFHLPFLCWFDRNNLNDFILFICISFA